MSYVKTKAVMNIEKRMDSAKDEPMRHQVLKSAKDFKTSWIELGRALYSVWKDKLYKNWGFSTFDIYTVKEIGVRKATAVKLLKSYYFIEKEEPRLIERSRDGEEAPAKMPSYESINLLRLARGKELATGDYEGIKRKILDEGRDAVEIRKDLTSIMKKREELMPEDAWRKKKESAVRRIVGALRSLSIEIRASKLLPAKLLTDIEKLIEKLDAEI